MLRLTILGTLTFQNGDPPWFWILLFVGALAVLALTYKGLYQRSKQRLTWMLLALRVLALVVLLLALVKPAWKSQVQRTEQPIIAVVLDDSQSMSLPHRTLAAGTDETGVWTPRYRKAVRLLYGSQIGQRLHERANVALFDITGKPIDQPPREPNAEQTDLGRALGTVAERLRGQPAASVLLISDGLDTTGRRNFLAMQDYPLHLYGVGFPQPPAAEKSAVDLAIQSIQSPQRTLVNNSVPVKLLVSKDGGGELNVPIYLERAGTTLMTEHVKLPTGSIQQMFTLNFTPTEPGNFVFSARLSAKGNEPTIDNNRRMFRLTVHANSIRVLYIEGILRSEYSFLHERLSQDPDIDLATFVRSSNPEQTSPTGALLNGELINAERIEKIDVILLGDFEARMLDEQTYRVLRDWVDGGGAMMVLGGYHNLGAKGLWLTPLADALPVEPLGESSRGFEQIEHRVTLVLTEEGKRHPVFTITGDRIRDEAQWQDLPSLHGMVATGGPKPGAAILARGRVTGATTGDDGAILLTTQSFGKGTVAVLAADTTWRWSRLPRMAGRPDTLYVRFWSQLIRWLAKRDVHNHPTALLVSTDEAAYDRGQRVTIQVQRNPTVLLPSQKGQDLALKVTVRSPEGRRVQVPTRRLSADPNQWRASYFPDRGGHFQIEASLTTQGTDVANQWTEFLVKGSTLEVDNPTTNPHFLDQLARFTGGAYADIDDETAIAQMIEQLPSEPRTTVQVRTDRLWNNPAMFAVFLVLVTAEWIGRRRHRLA